MSKAVLFSIANIAAGPRYVRAVAEAEIELPEPPSNTVLIKPGETAELYLTDGEYNSAKSRQTNGQPDFEISRVGGRERSAASAEKPLREMTITQLRKLAAAQGVQLTADETSVELIAKAIEDRGNAE